MHASSLRSSRSLLGALAALLATVSGCAEVGGSAQPGQAQPEGGLSVPVTDAAPTDAAEKDVAPPARDAGFNGQAQEGCACTQENAQQSCWPGPPDQVNIGNCRSGTPTCLARGSSKFITLNRGACTSDVLPPNVCTAFVQPTLTT